MTSYRLFPSTSGPASVAADSNAYSLGTEFYVTSAASFEGFWWWCATGASTTAKSFRLYSVTTATTGSAVSGTDATSGTLTANAWNWVPITTPVALTINQRYRAAIVSPAGFSWYGFTASGWPSDVTNGPLTAPSTANATGNRQGSFTTGATMSFPASSGSARYWLDLQVTDGAAPTLGTATTTETAQPLTGAKTATLGIGTTAEAAQALAGAKTASLTPATAVETAQALTGAKSTPLAPATVLETAQPATGTKTGVLTPATTVEAAQHLSAPATATLGTASEQDTALPLTGSKTAALAPATDTSTARPLAGSKLAVLGTAAESDTAQPIAPPEAFVDVTLTIGQPYSPWQAGPPTGSGWEVGAPT